MCVRERAHAPTTHSPILPGPALGSVGGWEGRSMYTWATRCPAWPCPLARPLPLSLKLFHSNDYGHLKNEPLCSICKICTGEALSNIQGNLRDTTMGGSLKGSPDCPPPPSFEEKPKEITSALGSAMQVQGLCNYHHDITLMGECLNNEAGCSHTYQVAICKRRKGSQRAVEDRIHKINLHQKNWSEKLSKVPGIVPSLSKPR